MNVAIRSLIVAGLMLAPSAAGQSPTPPGQPPTEASVAQTPLGRWKFETGMVTPNCKLSGEMQVLKAKTTGLYACHFVAVQSCTGNPPMEFHVQQTCIATQTGKQVIITSAIDKILSAKPAALLPLVKSGYAADNFDVTLNPVGSEMRGMFHSLNQATVRFWRPHNDLVS